MTPGLTYYDRLEEELLARHPDAVRHYAVHIANYVSTACWDMTNGASVKGYDHRTDDPDRVTCPLCLKRFR